MLGLPHQPQQIFTKKSPWKMLLTHSMLLISSSNACASSPTQQLFAKKSPHKMLPSNLKEFLIFFPLSIFYVGLFHCAKIHHVFFPTVLMKTWSRNQGKSSCHTNSLESPTPFTCPTFLETNHSYPWNQINIWSPLDTRLSHPKRIGCRASLSHITASTDPSETVAGFLTTSWCLSNSDDGR